MERRLTIAQELEDKPAPQETWGFLMTISTQLAQSDRTIKYYQTQLKLLQEIQDKVAEYICLYDLASFQFNNQQYQEALSGFETALQLAETLDGDSQKNYKKYRRFSFSRRVNPKGKVWARCEHRVDNSASITPILAATAASRNGGRHSRSASGDAAKYGVDCS